MFNLSKFNTTEFSSVGRNGIPVYTVASMHMTAAASFTLDRAMEAVAWLRCSSIAAFIRFRPLTGSAEMEMTAQGARTRFVFAGAEAEMVMLSAATGYRTFGKKQIELRGLDIRAGDEIIINTDDMTVTVNNQNAVSFLSGDSDFFKLKPGENYISVSGSDGSAADVYVIWKDRWL